MGGGSVKAMTYDGDCNNNGGRDIESNGYCIKMMMVVVVLVAVVVMKVGTKTTMVAVV